MDSIAAVTIYIQTALLLLDVVFISLLQYFRAINYSHCFCILLDY